MIAMKTTFSGVKGGENIVVTQPDLELIRQWRFAITARPIKLKTYFIRGAASVELQCNGTGLHLYGARATMPVMLKEPARRGPKPDLLKIEGDIETAQGWPK